MGLSPALRIPFCVCPDGIGCADFYAMLGSMGVETQVLGALVCYPLYWRNFCRSCAPDYIPLFPRAARGQVRLKQCNLPMIHTIIFDE